MVRKFEAFCDVLRRLFSDPLVYITFVCLALLSLFLGALEADPDLFARMAVGKLVGALGQVPTQDPFAFTLRKDIWIDHEWLAGVLFYYVNQVGGDFGLFLIKLLFAAASIILLANAQRIYADRHSGHFFWLLTCTVPCTYLWASTVRAQVFTWLLLPFFVFVCLRFERRGTRWLLYLLPFCMLVWVNAHGGFVLGLGYFALFLLNGLLKTGRLQAASLVSFFLCCLATLVTPYPPAEFWGYLYSALSMPRPTIPEWQAVGLFSAQSIPLLFAAAIIVCGFLRDKRTISPMAGAALLTSLALAFSSQRLAALFLFAAVVYGSKAWLALLELLTRNFETRMRRIKRAGAFLATCGMIFLVFETYHFLRSFRSFSLDYSHYPEQALQWLIDNRPGGKLLVDFNMGSYALWKLYPQFLISIDGRYEEVYPESTMRLVADALDPESPAHSESLNRISPDFILIGKQIQGIESAGAFPQEWVATYRDEKFSILARH